MIINIATTVQDSNIGGFALTYQRKLRLAQIQREKLDNLLIFILYNLMFLYIVAYMSVSVIYSA